VLFAGTIAENIAAGIDQQCTAAAATKEGGGDTGSNRILHDRIEAAAKLANAHGFITAFPKVWQSHNVK
jgi:ABC-type multidrug transport system fused ATPase/permease subunit